MFSGLIEEIGEVQDATIVKATDDILEGFEPQKKALEIRVKGDKVLEDIELGCSIAVDGVCLTVTSFNTTSKQFTADVATETQDRSTLGSAHAGSRVNLERAVAAGGRLGGHYVQGHVDGRGRISQKYLDRYDSSLWIRVQADDRLLRFIVPKGFIAIDGASLTVCGVKRSGRGWRESNECRDSPLVEMDSGKRRRGWFEVMLIPHTQNEITLSEKAIGDEVNLEVDVVSKIAVSAAESTVEAHLQALKRKMKTRRDEEEVAENGEGEGSFLARRSRRRRNPPEDDWDID